MTMQFAMEMTQLVWSTVMVPFCGHILKLEIRRSFRYFVHECTSSQNKIVCSNVDIQAREPAVRLRNIKAEGRN
jgi:hypothetical protein